MADTPWLLRAPLWSHASLHWVDGSIRKGRDKRGPDQLSIAEETLSKLAAVSSCCVTLIGWDEFVCKARDKSNLAPDVCHLPHKAARERGHDHSVMGR
jgi:hypothetical protein